jgi:hypothetical protein
MMQTLSAVTAMKTSLTALVCSWLFSTCLSAQDSTDSASTNSTEKGACPFVCFALVEINGAPIAVLSNIYTGSIVIAHHHNLGIGFGGWTVTGFDMKSGVVTVSKFGKVFALQVGQGIGEVPMMDIACQDRDLRTVIAQYAQLTGRTMLPAPGLSGTVTIIASGPVPRSIAPDILTSAIEMTGYTLVRLPHATKVVPLSGAARQPVPLER